MKVIRRSNNGWKLVQSAPTRVEVPLIVKAQGLYALWRWLLRKSLYYPHPTKKKTLDYVAVGWVLETGRPVNMYVDITEGRPRIVSDHIPVISARLDSWPVGEERPISDYQHTMDLHDF